MYILRLIKHLVIFSLYAGLSCSGLLLLKLAMSDRGTSDLISIMLGHRFLVGFLLYGFGFLTWLYILSKYRLSIAYPVASSLLFILVAIGSYLVFQEMLSGKQIAGAVLCLCGIILVNP